jgi:hypothetical protein
MTRDQAVARIKRHLGFKQTLDTEIVEELQDAQIDLELRPGKPWFLLSEESTTTTTPNDDRVLVPADMLEEHEDGGLEYVPSDPDELPVKLKKDEWQVLKKNFRETANGPPKAYALVGQYFRLLPPPDLAYTLRFIYYKKALLLTSNIENEWLKYAPRLLMGIAGMKIAGGPIRDTVAYNLFQGWEQQGTVALINQNTAREMANMELQMGGPH